MRITALSALSQPRPRLPRRADQSTDQATPAHAATVQELTRDLAGWSMPPAGPASTGQPMAQWLW